MAARSRSDGRTEDLVAVLDVGTSKTVCLVAAVPGARSNGGGPDRIHVLGLGNQPSRGLKAGVVVALDEAELCVRAAASEAEEAAGLRLDEVFVAVACGRLKSVTFAADTAIERCVVSNADIERLMAAGRTFAERDGRTILRMDHVCYRLDGASGVEDPRGMAGGMLSADLVVITADDAPLRNLLHVVEQAYLAPRGVIPAPYAAGLAATTEKERDSGVICIDMGAGTTTLSIFAEGHLLAADTLPVGGNNITFDLARALSMPMAEAERIKKECGTMGEVVSDEGEVIPYALAGVGEPTLNQATRAQVRSIVRSRVAGVFGHIAERIECSGVARYAMQQLVLTGGGSQLAGVCEIAAEMLARPVRVGSPQPTGGVPEELCKPEFSTTVGLVQAAFDPRVRSLVQRRKVLEPVGYLGRVGQWLRESF